jgi:hypothetical protein
MRELQSDDMHLFARAAGPGALSAVTGCIDYCAEWLGKSR